MPAARNRVIPDAPILAAVATEPIQIERVIIDHRQNSSDNDAAAADAWARKFCDEG